MQKSLTRLLSALLLTSALAGCGGIVHLDLPPRVLVPPPDGERRREPPEPAPLRPSAVWENSY